MILQPASCHLQPQLLATIYLGFIKYWVQFLQIMEDLEVKDMEIVPCINSKYVQPSRLRFNQV